MARKVTDISIRPTEYTVLSQTPGNYDKQNFFLKELQQKVDREWKYRPNRVMVEFQTNWQPTLNENPILSDEIKWSPIEVVNDTIKNDKGLTFFKNAVISDDHRSFIFQDIRESRFSVGSKFRTCPDYNIETMDNSVKNTWLVLNLNKTDMTSSVHVVRCNNTIGSVWTDAQGITHNHYEPIVFNLDLRTVNLFYNEVAIEQNAETIGVVQHNKFSRHYAVNQRFIIGYDTVYRIKAISKFSSLYTEQADNIGAMKIYFEKVDASPYDNFETRIAYQQQPSLVITQSTNNDNYQLKFDSPTFIPSSLLSTPVTFKVFLYNKNVKMNVPVILKSVLSLCPAALVSQYVTSTKIDDNTFVLNRIRPYLSGDLILTFYVDGDTSPTGQEISATISLIMRDSGE